MADALNIMNKFETDPDGDNKVRPRRENETPRNDRNKENKDSSNKVKTELDDEAEDGVTLVQESVPQKKPLSKGEMQLLQQVVEEDCGEDDDNFHFMFTTVSSRRSKIPVDWILLDNQSTCHIFHNRDLIQNIRKCKKGDEIKISSNGNGFLIANEICDLPGLGPVHFHPGSIANVLSFSKVSKKFTITYDNRVEDSFIVHGNNRKIRFIQSEKGLFFHKVYKGPQGRHLQLIQTVKGNEACFTKRQVDKAKLARRIYIVLGRPSHDSFVSFIRNNNIRNYPIEVEDVHLSSQIYGPDIAAVRGKTTRVQPGHVLTPVISPVPEHILRLHPKIHLCVDVCFVNNIPFLITTSRNIKLRTVDPISDVSHATILTSLTQVMRIYSSRGFEIGYIHGDGGFKTLENDLLPARLNITAAGEHVPEVERSIRTIKERTRACIHGLPFRRHPTQMIIANVRHHNS